MRTASYCLVFAFVLAGLPLADARNWTIQTFAFGSRVQADTVVRQLREVGLDAYTSVPAESELRQVRIGCFSAQADAEALAQDVRQRVAEDAQVVPFVSGDAATVCVARQLGFMPPDDWGIETSSNSSVTFWLGAGGRRTITFDGQVWRLQQGESEPLAALPPFADDPTDALLESSPPAGLNAIFRATQSRGLPLLRADLGGGSLLITAGRLLWASAQVAVVEAGADVFALRLYRP